MFNRIWVCLLAVVGFSMVGCNKSAPPTELGDQAQSSNQAIVDALKKVESDPNAGAEDLIKSTGIPGGKGKMLQQAKDQVESGK